MITDDEIEKAVDWLKENAKSSANSRATRIYLEEYRKSLKALIMREYLNLPVSAQEREAYADARYIKHLNALKIAVEEDEKNKFLRASADAKIEAWRTFQANNRIKL
tara:strand:- start:41 stop:361 length:321 start_codon:yes stop_codon:yes gene_type:complete